MPELPKHVVDFHTHAFPEKVAARAVSVLATTYAVRPVAEPTITGLLSVMDEVGIAVSVVLPVATRADQVRAINDWAAETTSDRVVCFGAIHPELPEAVSEVDRIVGLGLKGIKLQPNFQQFSPEDERLWPVYEAAAGRLVAVFHSGQEIAALEHVHAQPAAVAKVHRAFPQLTMVLAHMGGYQMWDEAQEHLVGRNVYLDSSYCPERELGDEQMMTLIEAHGFSRVLFATDFPWGQAREDLGRLCRLGIDQEECEAIAWRNARDLLGLSLV